MIIMCIHMCICHVIISASYFDIGSENRLKHNGLQRSVFDKCVKIIYDKEISLFVLIRK